MKVKSTGPILMVVCYVSLKGMYKKHLAGFLVSEGSICMVTRFQFLFFRRHFILRRQEKYWRREGFSNAEVGMMILVVLENRGWRDD